MRGLKKRVEIENWVLDVDVEQVVRLFKKA